MMKKLMNLMVAILLFTGSSCEEVVEIELESSEPRLVVEASLTWLKGSEENSQQIILSKTAPFYEEENPSVEDALVFVKTEEGIEYEFTHSGNGIYTNGQLLPESGQLLKLEIYYNDELYSGTEKMIPVTDIDYVEQNNSGGFSGDEIEIKSYYTDPADEENYYLFIFRNNKTSLEIYEDEFTNGNQIFGYFSNEDIEPEDSIEIEMYGISKAYYEYLFILRTQVGGNGGGPFETRPATVKGNMVNRTNKENFPFGYFHLSEVDTTTYIVE